jgi:uncharacterized protein YfaS (alpha-2-macroglobulin family)
MVVGAGDTGMARLPRLALVALMLIGGAIGAARADDFQLPGLSSDSQAYFGGLTKRHPAGGTPQQIRVAEQQIAAAQQKKDTPAEIAALEERISLGSPTSRQWLDLGNALMRRAPPDPKRALAAAWQNFTLVDSGEPELPALLLMADALRAMDRPDQAALALEQAVQIAPDNASYKAMLGAAQAAAGLVVRRVQTEAETDPPRACIAFSVPPRRDDLNVQDWVRLDPPVPDAAVTREDDQICVSGLPSGQTTRVVLRAGLPGQGGLALARETTLAIAMPNRQPSILFDSRLFVLPRGQAPGVTLTTVNISTVSLRLMRLTERSTVAFLRDNRLGTAVEGYAADQIADTFGNVVWEGKADITGWKRNVTAKTALPIPDVLLSAGPGLYALEVQAGDGTQDVAAATQLILRTDLAPTVWRGADGLTVQMRGYTDAKPREGVRLQLLAHNNDILAETTTDADGVARFALSLLHGDGPSAPAVVHAFGKDGDFAALDLDAASFDLSDRGVSGASQPGPLDAFVWLDRGIYRPGETVNVMALLRDSAGQPVDFPARVTIKRPNGLVFFQANPARRADDAVFVPVQLSGGAPAGTWTVEVRSDPNAPPVGTAEFRVDAFVPDRMAVDVGPVPPVLVPGQSVPLPVTARFLYGAPAANLSGKASLSINIDPQPFAALAGWRIGLADEAFAPDQRDIAMADTDAKGQTVVPLLIDHAPDTTQAVKADILVEVNDPSGHASRAVASVPIRSVNPFIAIKPLFDGGSVDAGAEAGFDVVAVKPDGTRMAMPAKLRLVRERPNWRIVRRGGLARYETVWRDEPLETKDVAIPADQPLHIAQKLDFGRYRIEVSQAGGMAITSYRFHAGWVTSDSPDVPDRVEVSTDRQVIPAGDHARIHIAAPFGGEATLLVLSDRVHSLRTLSVAEGGTDVDVPVDASWGPGAYVAVHVFRGGGAMAKGDPRPDRAIGLVWVGVDPAARTLPVAIQAAEKYAPRGRVTVPVKTAPGAWVTLAAVDEGILRLTNFPSPNPAPHFLGRRTLGIDIRDDWGRLIAPAEGEATLLRQGGDEGSFVLPDIPQHTVTLFTPPAQADGDGMVAIPLDWPDFNGQVRLMAVGWQGNRIGSASTDVLVRDALVAEPLLPRFLAPGDQARMAVLLNNLDLKAGDATVKISLDGPLEVTGASTLGANLAPGQQVVAATVLHATGAGRGVIHLDVTGPDNFHIRREAAITIRPSRGAVATVAGKELPAGGEGPLAVSPAAYVAGTWTAAATFGAPVRYDAAALVDSLQDYPLGCLEQSTSKGFPLALFPDRPGSMDDRAGRLGLAVQSVLDKQRYDGGFGLWSSTGEAEAWLSPYAMEFLLRAKDAGAPVPEQALKDGLKFLADASDQDVDSPEAMAAQAYRLYVLARGGQGKPGLARVLAESLGKLPTPLAKAQLGASLALAHETPRAEEAFGAALAAPNRRFWNVDYGTATRDAAAITVLLKESGLLPDRLVRLSGTLPGSDLSIQSLSTQEEAWLAAAGAVLGRDGKTTTIALDGKTLPAAPVVSASLSGPASAKNLSERAVWESVAIRGVPLQAPAAARAGMRITRRFFTMDGGTLDLDQLKQNTVFVLLVEGRSDDGQDHQAMMLQGLPAGWEIAGRFNAGAVPGMDWLGELSETSAQPAADDRFAAVVDLTNQKPDFRVAVRLRAVTPGDYEIPGAELSDMYRPMVFARQGANRIKVLAPE